MKLLKKILIGIVVLIMIGVGLIGFGVFEAKKTYTEKIEPDMKRYVTMTSRSRTNMSFPSLGNFTLFPISGTIPR